MKKILLSLFLCVFLLAANAQNSSSSVVNELGIMLGPGYSMINGGESWSGTFGFQVGLETQVYKWNENSSLYVGLLFSYQGAAYEESVSIDPYFLKSTNDEVWSGTVRLGYICVPVLYNYLWDNGFYLEGGVQPGFLVSAKDEVDGADSYDYKDYIKTFDLGIPVGAGFWFNDRLSLGARAVFGVTNINTDGTDLYSSDDTDRNMMILGVARFKFNKK